MHAGLNFFKSVHPHRLINDNRSLFPGVSPPSSGLDVVRQKTRKDRKEIEQFETSMGCSAESYDGLGRARHIQVGG